MYLTKSDISNLTKKGLCYARNEIYARYGRKFKASELQEYFDNTTWYRAKYEPCEANDKVIIKKMNKYEKYNVDLLISIEKKSGIRSYFDGMWICSIKRERRFRSFFNTIFHG